jgi:hypothetical protein
VKERLIKAQNGQIRKEKGQKSATDFSSGANALK